VGCRSSTPRAIQALLLPLRTDGGARRHPRVRRAPSYPTPTVVAVRYVGGVVMVADRQATVLHSSREFEDRTADSYTALAISGTPRGHRVHPHGQLSFEHYEKMTTRRSASRARPTTSHRSSSETTLSSLSCDPLLAGWDLSHRWDGSSSTTVRWLLRTNGLRHDRLGIALRESTCAGLSRRPGPRGRARPRRAGLYEAGDKHPSNRPVRTSSGASFP